MEHSEKTDTQIRVWTRPRLKTITIVGIAIGAGWVAFAFLYRLATHTGVTMTADGCTVTQQTMRCWATPKRWLVFSVMARDGTENALRIAAGGLPPAATFAANGKGGYMFTWLPVVRPEKAPDITLKVRNGSRDVAYQVSLSWNE